MQTSTHLCSRCHQLKPVNQFRLDKRSKSGLGYWCRPCCAEARRVWRKRNPERAKELDRSFRLKRMRNNPAFNKEHYLRYKAYHKKKNLRLNYGIDIKTFDEMVTVQRGCCACCGDSTEILCVDHCHYSNTIRGLICQPCNKAIGFLCDSPHKAFRVAKYLLLLDEDQASEEAFVGRAIASLGS